MIKAPKYILEIHDLETFICETFSENTFSVQNNSFLIIWVQKGKGTCYVDLKEHAISSDTVYCISPSQVYCFNVCDFVKGYAFSFTSEFLCPLKSESDFLLNSGLFNMNSMTPIGVCIETKAEMEQLIESMTKEIMRMSELKTEILRALLKLFLMHLTRNTGRGRTQDLRTIGDANLVSQFLDMVEKNFMTMKKVTDYAEKLRITPNYLNIKIKKLTGFTTSYHIQQRIVLEAKRQALWAQMSLKEIAYLLGYDDLSHFSKFFKKSAGISFSNFKRSGPCGFESYVNFYTHIAKKETA